MKTSLIGLIAGCAMAGAVFATSVKSHHAAYADIPPITPPHVLAFDIPPITPPHAVAFDIPPITPPHAA